MSCNLDVSFDDTEPKMSFTIPEEIVIIDNSGDITVNGEAVTLSGEKLEVGDVITDVPLDKRADFFDQVELGSIDDFSGYRLIETVPSLDTPVCTMQTKQLEFAAGEFPDITFIIVSNDTPFALQRFCSANGIDNLQVMSDARTREFGIENSLYLEDYGLLTRSIMIINPDNEIEYIEYANEVTSELDLMNALAYLKSVTN
ncbi:peroxiredoxin [Candidatus Gracilibacteria bacterium]|nr:peroxiredoxin [Candidatus Gracilibacteria bacterium]